MPRMICTSNTETTVRERDFRTRSRCYTPLRMFARYQKGERESALLSDRRIMEHLCHPRFLFELAVQVLITSLRGVE